MIAVLGLLLPGNEEQIPFAFELYAQTKTPKSDILFQRFQRAFSHRNVRVHFLGAWDTVSSVGIFRGKSLPMTDQVNSQICYFRHALALDERRVKFLPEYVCGGVSDGDLAYINAEGSANPGMVRTKEVWFAGCHSDIGGGKQQNAELNSEPMPLIWMWDEAHDAGLRFERQSKWEWEKIPEKIRNNKPTNSLTLGWRLMEILPFRRLSYMKAKEHVCSPHLAHYRVVKPGQKIHVSVAFIEGYASEATLPTDGDWKDINWGKFKGIRGDNNWARGLESVLEMHIFDVPDAMFIQRAKAEMNDLSITDCSINDHSIIDRLFLMISTRQGAQNIMTSSGLQLIRTMLDNSKEYVKNRGAHVLSEIATRADLTALPADVVELLTKTLIDTLTNEYDQVRLYGAEAAGRVFKDRDIRYQLTQMGVHEHLYAMINKPKPAEERAAAQYAFNVFIQLCDGHELIGIQESKLGNGPDVLLRSRRRDLGRAPGG